MNNVTKIIAIFLIVSVTINLVIFSYYTEKGYTVGTILEKFSDNENNLDLPKFPDIYLENKLQLSYEENVNSLDDFYIWKRNRF